MISVVVFSQKPDRAARLTADVLSRYGGVLLHTSGSSELLGTDRPRFSVEAFSRLEKMTLPDAVLVLADQSAPRQLELSESTIVITSSDNRRAHRLLSGHSNPVVVCGTGVRDTLTVSSMDRHRAILCAQRALPTVSGGWLDPFEFTMDTHSHSIRSALLLGGVAAVCGCDLSSGQIVTYGH